MAHLVRWWSFTYDFNGVFSIATFNCSSGVCFFWLLYPPQMPHFRLHPFASEAWSRAWIGAAYLEYVTCRVRPETEESKHPEVSEDEVILPPKNFKWINKNHDKPSNLGHTPFSEPIFGHFYHYQFFKDHHLVLPKTSPKKHHFGWCGSSSVSHILSFF